MHSLRREIDGFEAIRSSARTSGLGRHPRVVTRTSRREGGCSLGASRVIHFGHASTSLAGRESIILPNGCSVAGPSRESWASKPFLCRIDQRSSPSNAHQRQYRCAEQRARRRRSDEGRPPASLDERAGPGRTSPADSQPGRRTPISTATVPARSEAACEAHPGPLRLAQGHQRGRPPSGPAGRGGGEGRLQAPRAHGPGQRAGGRYKNPASGGRPARSEAVRPPAGTANVQLEGNGDGAGRLALMAAATHPLHVPVTAE